MKKTFAAIAMVGLGLVFAGSARAATMGGKSELRVDGSIMSTTYRESDTLTVSGQIVFNRFLADFVSLGISLRPSISTSSNDDSDDETTSRQLFILGRVDFYIPTGARSPFVPYGGLHAGAINYAYESGGDDEDTATVVTGGGQIGAKLFITEKTSLNFELDGSVYKPEDDEYSGDENDENVTVATFTVGYSVYF